MTRAPARGTGSGAGYAPDRALRRAIGLSPKQLLMNVRIDEATKQLEDTDRSLSAIVIECGYYDQSSFTRQFQRAVGVAPGACRAEVRSRRAGRRLPISTF